MAAKIIYHYFENDVQRQQIAEALKRVGRWVPWWVHELHIYHCRERESDSRALMDTGSDTACRWMTIIVYPDAFDEPAEDLVAVLAHEIMHGRLAPIVDFVREGLLAPLKDRNVELHDALAKQFDVVHQAAVEDLAIAAVGPCPS